MAKKFNLARSFLQEIMEDRRRREREETPPPTSYAQAASPRAERVRVRLDLFPQTSSSPDRVESRSPLKREPDSPHSAGTSTRAVCSPSWSPRSPSYSPPRGVTSPLPGIRKREREPSNSPPRNLSIHDMPTPRRCRSRRSRSREQQLPVSVKCITESPASPTDRATRAMSTEQPSSPERRIVFRMSVSPDSTRANNGNQHRRRSSSRQREAEPQRSNNGDFVPGRVRTERSDNIAPAPAEHQSRRRSTSRARKASPDKENTAPGARNQDIEEKSKKQQSPAANEHQPKELDFQSWPPFNPRVPPPPRRMIVWEPPADVVDVNLPEWAGLRYLQCRRNENYVDINGTWHCAQCHDRYRMIGYTQRNLHQLITPPISVVPCYRCKIAHDVFARAATCIDCVDEFRRNTYRAVRGFPLHVRPPRNFNGVM